MNEDGWRGSKYASQVKKGEKFFYPITTYLMMSTERNSVERVPILSSRSNIDAWKRQFNDYCTGRNLWGILRGTEAIPEPINAADLALIPAASRYQAQLDREKKRDNYLRRQEKAFAAVCKAMEKDNLIYGCAQLDALRDQAPRDARAAYTLVLEMLEPSHVDAQMTVDTLITTLSLETNESVPALIQRLAGYIQRLPLANRPNDESHEAYKKGGQKEQLHVGQIQGQD